MRGLDFAHGLRVAACSLTHGPALMVTAIVIATLVGLAAAFVLVPCEDGQASWSAMVGIPAVAAAIAGLGVLLVVLGLAPMGGC